LKIHEGLIKIYMSQATTNCQESRFYNAHKLGIRMRIVCLTSMRGGCDIFSRNYWCQY